MHIDPSRYSYITDFFRMYRVLPTDLRHGAWRLFLFQTVTALLESSTVIVISFFMMAVSSPESARNNHAFATVLRYLPEYWVTRLQGGRTFITAMCLILVLFITLKNLAIGYTMRRATRFSENLGLFIRSETYKRYLNKSYFWHISPESGQVMRRLGNCQQLTAMTTCILQFFGYVLCCLFMFMTLFLYEPYLTLVLLAVFSLVGVATYKGVRQRIDKAGHELARLTAQEKWSVNMATQGIREIIIYRKQDVFYNNIVSALEQEAPHRAFLSFAGMLPSWLLEVSGFIAIFGVMVTLSHLGRPIPEIIGSVSMLFLSAWRVLPAVSRSMSLTVAIKGYRPMALNCLELLEGFASEKNTDKTIPAANFHFLSKIDLGNVCFRYPDAAADCLHSISLSIGKGESVALIGSSGAGKSTLAMILAGLLEPASGEVRIDGKLLDANDREAYRQKLGYVPQTPLLLPGTVADNVALAHWGEKYDREKVKTVCEQAAVDFLGKDASGLNLLIGEGGLGLSGGQAQRVAIARALFDDPEVVVFDEATSSLDIGSENTIIETIKGMKGRITTIIIAHRMTSVETCDRVIWLSGGRVVAEGAPKDIVPKYLEHSRNNTKILNAPPSADGGISGGGGQALPS